MPISLYSGALIGLRRVGLLSSVNAANATIKNVGALLAVLVVSATPETFFAWQAAAAVAAAFVARWSAYHSLALASVKPHFELPILRRSLLFAADMSGVSIGSIVTHNIDKIALAKVLPLAAFGIYSLAVTLSSVLLLFTSAVYMSTIARITAAIESRSVVALRSLFAEASDMVCLLVCPAGAVMMVMADRCMQIATGDPNIGVQNAWVFGLASFSAVLNALAWPPYSLLVGAGCTRGIFKAYLYGALTIAPMVVLASVRFGAIGAAVMMVVYQALNLVCMVWISRARGLMVDVPGWVLHNVYAFNAVAFLPACAVREALAALPGGVVDVRIATPLALAVCYLASLGCSGLYMLSRRRHAFLAVGPCRR
jgi:O-antigen/teichoic acid export membrane protein